MKNEIGISGTGTELFQEMIFVTRTLLQRGGRSMEELGIGIGQLPVLELLYIRGTMTQRELAEEIRVTPATISGTMKRMEKIGMIRRTAAENDARVSRVSLTEKGRLCYESAGERINRQFVTAVEDFDESERRLLADFLHRMSANLDRSAEASEGETDE